MPRISNPSQDRADYIADLAADFQALTYVQLLDELAKLNDDIDKQTERDLMLFDHWARHQSGPMDAEDAVASCRARGTLDTTTALREAVARVIVERDTRLDTSGHHSQLIASLQRQARNIVADADGAAR